MPIKIQDSLPAQKILENENIFVMTEYRAMHQDIRPLHVLILNLMPTKIETETQLLRKLSNTPLWMWSLCRRAVISRRMWHQAIWKPFIVYLMTSKTVILMV